MTSVGLALLFIAGFIVGMKIARLEKLLHDLQERFKRLEKQPEPTVTKGAYQNPKPINNMDSQDKGIGLVMAKTPQRLEWESSQELERNVKLGVPR